MVMPPWAPGSSDGMALHKALFIFQVILGSQEQQDLGAVCPRCSCAQCIPSPLLPAPSPALPVVLTEPSPRSKGLSPPQEVVLCYRRPQAPGVGVSPYILTRIGAACSPGVSLQCCLAHAGSRLFQIPHCSTSRQPCHCLLATIVSISQRKWRPPASNPSASRLHILSFPG